MNRPNLAQLAPLVVRAYNDTRGPGEPRWHWLASGEKMRLMAAALRAAKGWGPN